MTDPTTPTTDRRCINCGESIDAPRHSVWATKRDGACHFEDGASVEKRAADLREWAHAADTAPGEWAPVTVLVFRRIEAEAAASALSALRAEVEGMGDPWAQSDGRPDKVSVARVLAAIDRIAKAEPDAFEAAIENAEPWRFPAKAEPEDKFSECCPICGEPWAVCMCPDLAAKAEPEGESHDPDYMCPNCVTPWKCNGPHIPEGESRGD